MWDRKYTAWFLADTTGQAMSAIRSFAFPVVVLASTGSVTTAGLSASLAIMSGAFSMPVGGWLQDRWDRRMLLALWGVSGILLFAFAVLAVLWLPTSTWQWLALAVLFGLRSGILGSVSNVLLRSVVSAKDLPNAMAMQDGRDAALSMAGPPIGGVLLSISYWLPFAVGVIFSAISTVCTFFIPRHNVSPSAQNVSPTVKEAERITAGFWDGMIWLKNNQFSFVLAVFGTPIITIFNCVILVAGLDLVRRGVNPGIVGLADTSAAAGALIGSVLVAPLRKRIRGSWLVIAAFAVPAICAMASGLFTHPGLRIACFIPAFLLLPVGNAVVGAIQISIIPDKLLGRVFSSVGLLEGGISAVAVWIASRGLDLFGYRVVTVIAGVVILLLLTVVIRRCRIGEIPKPEGIAEFSRSVA
ncbi:MFS transporter [Devriesea agamarum]|uniref:MFS transporter n=1 Tax=Devriesea agamarum TaxID=472569 RepID=UPI00071C67BC|nr:MFS transporter [Devriesea agamarum]